MWTMTMTRLFDNFIRNRKQIYRHWRTNAVALRLNYSSTDAINLDLFSEEDKNKILEIINSKSTEDLLQYSITKRRAQNLESHRINNGPYKSLEDLLQIKSLNYKSLFTFYKSIIFGKRQTPRKITRGLVMTPKEINGSQEGVNKVLGIYIGQEMISWSLLSRDCEVLQWSYKFLPNDLPKENLHTLLEATLLIAAKLPKADRYIMQEISSNVGNQQNRQSHVYIEHSIINAIIMSHLTMSNCKLGNITEFITNNIFILRPKVLRKIYGLIVGNETISTQYMLQKLLRESDKLLTSKEHLPSVLINTEFKKMYNRLSPIHQEQISWPLLIALAFLELVVHERKDMVVRATA